MNSNSYNLIDSIENLQAVYILEITDDDNCTITDTFSVSEPTINNDDFKYTAY